MAVVGLGYWGPNLARNLQELDCAEVVAALRHDLGAPAGDQQRYRGVRMCEHLDDILADDNVDAVAIATPVSSHFTLGCRVLEAGKHLFTEKPLGGLSGRTSVSR